MLPVEIVLKADSIAFDYPKEFDVTDSLFLYGYNDTWESEEVLINDPKQKVKLNPLFTDYTLYSSDFKKSRVLFLSDFQANINLNYERTKDSLTLQIFNPRKVPVWYALYRGENLLEKGQEDGDVEINKLASSAGVYTIYYKYLWAGEIK